MFMKPATNQLLVYNFASCGALQIWGWCDELLYRQIQRVCKGICTSEVELVYACHFMSPIRDHAANIVSCHSAIKLVAVFLMLTEYICGKCWTPNSS